MQLFYILIHLLIVVRSYLRVMEKDKQKEFLELFETVREKLYRFVRAMCKNDEQAKDIVSETVLQTFERFEKIDDLSSFKSYVFTIASRIYKRQKWRMRIFGEYNDDYAENISQSTNTDINYDIEMLYKALDELGFKTKQAIILFEISGFAIKEISKIQNSTDSAVKSRLLRGRKKLKEILVPDIDEVTKEFQEVNFKEKKIQMSEL